MVHDPVSTSQDVLCFCSCFYLTSFLGFVFARVGLPQQEDPKHIWKSAVGSTNPVPVHIGSLSYYVYNVYIYLQGINISHLGKRKIIFKMPFWGYMLVSWRVYRRYFRTSPINNYPMEFKTIRAPRHHLGCHTCILASGRYIKFLSI